MATEVSTRGTEATRPPLQLLRESLRADSPVREQSVAKAIVICCAVAIPFIFSLALFQSAQTSIEINVLLSVVAVYYLGQLRAMKRGWYHPAIAWSNVLLEVSVPAGIILLTAIHRGSAYSHMTPTHVIWGALIVASALRATPRLSLAAGIVAAVEWLAMYFAVIARNLPPDAPASLHLPAAILRAVILIMCGGFGFLIARHFIRKTEEALKLVREQDLMGKYFLHDRLGSGGMAEVWRATYCPEGGFQKPVAIKRVLPTFSQSASFVEMFREEARLCASLNHPNIVQVFDCGRYKDSFILAMEFVDGLPLNRLLRRMQKPLPFNAITYLAAELANALDYIHKKVGPDGKPLHLVHRDVNPPNILVSRIGEVKLGDFGVANAATRVETGRTDIFYGKIHYAAPEQIVVGPFDGRADLFAMGLTLIETITRAKVYSSDDDAALNKGIFPRIPRPSELRADTPPELEELVMRLVAHDASRRPATGAELRAQINALQGELAPYPNGQIALAQAIEETIALGVPDKAKVKVTPMPAGGAAGAGGAGGGKEGGHRATEVFAREKARGKSSPSRSAPARAAAVKHTPVPPPVGKAAPTANMRAVSGAQAERPNFAASASSTEALTDDELKKALERAAKGSSKKAAAAAPARDPDEDTLLDEDEAPPAAAPKAARK